MIEVISPGIYSSIQDQGRFGYRHLGVPVSGAMDLFSANLANILLNNDTNAAIMEMTLVGAKLKFLSDAYICITGARCALKRNCVLAISKGEVIDFGHLSNGQYSYLAVADGFMTKKYLGSRSFYKGITPHYILKKGDKLALESTTKKIINRTAIKSNRNLFNATSIQASKGPEFHLLGENTQAALFKNSFKISPHSNRMAIKLEHAIAQLNAKEIITSAVQPGTIQLTPSGQLIALMRDCQTTGGYARVLQLPEFSINQLTQKPANSTFKFTVL